MNRGERRRLRTQLWEAQGGLCCWCDRMMNRQPGSDAHPEPLNVTLEHLTPRNLGGTDAIENLAAACFECNQNRADLPLIDITTPEGRTRALGLHTFLARMATCQPLRKALL